MNILEEVNAVQLSTSTVSCEAGVEVIHPAFVPIMVITSVMIA